MHTHPTDARALTTLLLLTLVTAACSDPQEQPTVNTAACRQDSDCAPDQRCDEGACLPVQADCVTDADCSNDQLCDRSASACVTRECQDTLDCPLGALCLQGQCLTDLTADRDRDGLPDLEDSCPGDPNPQDDDTDSDGRGDVCDLDDDADGVDDDADNCPLRPNPDQRDDDDNGRGDACEGDLDSDGVPDHDDNCPQTSNPDQRDSDALLPSGEPHPDADGLGDACDPDDDNDTTDDDDDNCQLISNPDQADADGNGTGDRCEPRLQDACGDCGVDRVEGSALFCRNPCDNQVDCVPDTSRCNAGDRQRCNLRGRWDDSPCADGQFCLEASPTQAACSSQLCTPDARRCLDGVTIEVCNEQGDAWRIDTLCPNTLLCQPAEDGAFACLDCAARCDHLLNAAPQCGPDGRGTCTFNQCRPGFASCDDIADNGCETPLNACGGCATLTGSPGSSCGTCGQYVCADAETLACDDPGANACGGCLDLADDPGTPCGACGQHTCSGVNATTCDDPGPNACGGCAALTGTPGTPCGTCNTGRLACNGNDALRCEGDLGSTVLNACGGCATLTDTLGATCGPCGRDRIACDGTDATRCDGETTLNNCGGCTQPATPVGTPCGPCGFGQFVCDGAEHTLCAPVCGRACTTDAECAPAALCTAGRCAPAGLAVVTPATFRLGSPAAEPGRDPDETLQDVTLTRGLLAQRTEVTQRQWFDLMFGTAPFSHTTCTEGAPACDSDLPAESITWFQALAFANRLSEREGLERCYRDAATPGRDYDLTNANADELPALPIDLDCRGYRLPTEAEWERMTRAGSQAAFFTGPILSAPGPDPNLDPIGWYASNSQSMTWPVALKTPNPFGLYDTHGNVAEWTWDRYASTTPAGTDPTGPDTGASRVLRGGAFNDTPARCRAAERDALDPAMTDPTLGLRLVRSIRLCDCPDLCEVLTECDDGCFDLNADIDRCGGCNVSCRRPHRPSPACFQGACDLGPCEDGYWDVDGDEANGCEYACDLTNGGVETCDRLDNDCDGEIDEDFDLYADPDNCGSCGQVCAFLHAQPLCVAGQCEMGACDDFYHDEDGRRQSGCEVYLNGLPLYVSEFATGPGNRDTGHPFPTINAALAAALPGDTIEVRPGTYTERFTVGMNHITVKGAGPALTHIRCPSMPSPPESCVTLAGPFNRLQGVTVDAGGYPRGVLIHGQCGVGCQITDTNIGNMRSSSGQASNVATAGIHVSLTSNTRIVNVQIDNLLTTTDHITEGIGYYGRGNDFSGGEIINVQIIGVTGSTVNTTYGIQLNQQRDLRLVGVTLDNLQGAILTGITGESLNIQHSSISGLRSANGPIRGIAGFNSANLDHLAIYDVQTTVSTSDCFGIALTTGALNLSNALLLGFSCNSSGILAGTSSTPISATIQATHFDSMLRGIFQDHNNNGVIFTWSSFRNVSNREGGRSIATFNNVVTIPTNAFIGLTNTATRDLRLLDGSPLIDAANPAADCSREPTSPTGSCRLDIGNYGNTPRARAAP